MSSLSDAGTPRVQVPIEELVLRPGQTITLHVHDHRGERTKIEVRSVGRLGSAIGIPEVFCDDGDLRVLSFDEWREINEQYRWLAGIPVDPKPAKK